MRRLPADDCADADDGVPLAGAGEPPRQQRNLERAWDAEHLDVLLVRAEAFERVERALDQPRGQEIVPAAGDDGEAKALGVESSLMSLRLQDFYSKRPRLMKE